MWELAYKESWAPKNWCFWTVVLEKNLESSLDCKEIQPVHPKGDQSWVFIGKTDVEAETPILWPPVVKSWLIWKDPDTGKDWGQEEKGTTEDEMVGWHNQLNGHEFGQAPIGGDGQGGLVCCSSWGCKESDMTERLNWIIKKCYFIHFEISPEFISLKCVAVIVFVYNSKWIFNFLSNNLNFFNKKRASKTVWASGPQICPSVEVSTLPIHAGGGGDKT